MIFGTASEKEGKRKKKERGKSKNDGQHTLFVLEARIAHNLG